MKKLLILGIFLTGSYSACYSEETPPKETPPEISQVGIEVEIGGDDDYYYDEGGPVIWIGPGLYYGIWFYNEWEYNDWHSHHRHRYRHGHGHHRGKRHGGGHHRGKKHGGKHHRGKGHGRGHR